jgi:hypothetical protein
MKPPDVTAAHSRRDFDVTFRAGRMVRTEYFGEASEALEAGGLRETSGVARER